MVDACGMNTRRGFARAKPSSLFHLLKYQFTNAPIIFDAVNVCFVRLIGCFSSTGSIYINGAGAQEVIQNALCNLGICDSVKRNKTDALKYKAADLIHAALRYQKNGALMVDKRHYPQNEKQNNETSSIRRKNIRTDLTTICILSRPAFLTAC